MFKELFNDPATVLITAFVAAAFVRALIYQFNVRRNGIEAEAVVDYISLESHSDADGIQSYYDYHVSYRDHKGIYRRSVLSNPAFGIEEGDIIVIRYTEENPEAPVYIRKVK